MSTALTNKDSVSERRIAKRQGKRIPKTDYHFRMQDCNYDWLCELARKHGVSVAKIINAILREKPTPNEFYVK